MTPKQFIKYIKKLDKRGLAVCDGVTEDINFFQIFITLFIIGGVWLILKWIWFKLYEGVKK